MKNPVIGLFGTCGNSTWRQKFMERYAAEGIEFFNPQVPEWKPELAAVEASHLANDEIVLFPVTSETYGSGSLAEVGFWIYQALRFDDRHHCVIMIHRHVDEVLKGENPVAAMESMRARALVLEHLTKMRLDNIYVVETFEEMLEASVTLYRAVEMSAPLKQYNPHRKQS